MVKSNEIEKVWVDKEFRKYLKKKAVDANVSVLQYTRMIAQNKDFIKEVREKYDDKKKFKIF